jgi:signal transduction histidine kinase
VDFSSRRAVWLALPLLIACACGTDRPTEDVRLLDRARFGIVDVLAPPRDSDLREFVALPDYWNQNRPEAAGIGWYRVTAADLPLAADEPWGLYVPSSSSSFEVFVAGERLGPIGFGDEATLQNWNRPEYFALPAALMREGALTIDIRLWAREGNYRGLGALEVGPARVLWPRFRTARFWQVEIYRLWLVLGVTLTLFAAGMWGATGRSSMYGSFVWLAAAWLAPVVVQSTTRFPGGFWLGQWLVHVGLSQMAIASIFLAHRILDVARPKTERALLVAGAAVAGALACAAGFVPDLFDPLANAFHLAALSACFYLPWLFANERAKLAPIESIFLVAGTLALVLISAHDMAVQLTWLPPDSVRLLPHAIPFILTMFFSVLVSRFLQLYRRAEQQNSEMEARIREKFRELEDRYAELEQLQRAGVLADERARMTREMHDGMGAQLISLLSLVESNSVDPKLLATGLRESLDELRLVIHSLEPTGSEAGTLLALLRERFAARIDQSGLRFQWRVGTSGDDIELSPERALHLVRIVEEAITNVLKHAHARTVEIATTPETRDGVEGLTIRITDDGDGLRDAHTTTGATGRGLENMRRRGHSLGGSLSISDADGGTTVELWLPDEGR